jgi:glutamyl-tRNA synthetase
VVLRNDDLDRDRVRPEYVTAFLEDLRWFGMDWDEGPDVGGPYVPYSQSERLALYRAAFGRLRDTGWIFPCTCSRKDIQTALGAPHAGDEEPVYPGTCRHRHPDDLAPAPGRRVHWRFRVPQGEAIEFSDVHLGPQRWIAGTDFGDFVVWRHDDLPSYQLACVVDDDAMRITEVVRGADLLLSTARQLLLYRALGGAPPAFFHAPLVTDAQGVRLAKRHDALSLRALRDSGSTPEDLRRGWPEWVGDPPTAP